MCRAVMRGLSHERSQQGNEFSRPNGPALVFPGMKGQATSLPEGAHLDVIEGGSIPARALVQFENGMSLLGNKWEKITKP